MTKPDLAPWVEPLSTQLAESRREVEEAVRRIPGTAWDRPSAYPGWSYKDHLSHLSESHRGVQAVLQAVVAGAQPDLSRFARIDATNEENRRKHLSTPVDELLAAFIRASDETERLLSELHPEQASLSLGPMTVGQAMQGFAMHDAGHLTELRKATQA